MQDPASELLRKPFLGEAHRIPIPRTRVQWGQEGGPRQPRPGPLSVSHSVSRLPYRLVCLNLAGRDLGRVREQGGKMLRNEVPGPPVGLLLCLLVLEDA